VFFYLVDDGSCDLTTQTLLDAGLKGTVITHPTPEGLRNRCIDFFKYVDHRGFDFIGKIDNDCVVPSNWISGMLSVFEKSDVGILSPNVEPSNAALQYGKEDTDGLGYRPAEIVGGLWFMRADLIKDIHFEKHETNGLIGATTLLRQIVTEKEPKIGWVSEVIVQDIGHWSGKHKEHIKSIEHEEYSKEVGRPIAWKADACIQK
jgi:glycosyltransferase involved in cell wall biosynthesis